MKDEWTETFWEANVGDRSTNLEKHRLHEAGVHEFGPDYALDLNEKSAGSTSKYDFTEI